MALKDLSCAARLLELPFGSCQCPRAVGLNLGRELPPTSGPMAGSSRCLWTLACWRKDPPLLADSRTQQKDGTYEKVRQGTTYARSSLGNVSTNFMRIILPESSQQSLPFRYHHCPDWFLVEADRSRGLEKIWLEFFSDPSDWWDYRPEKGTTRNPDFKHKKTEESLWVNYDLNPPCVEAEVAAMPPGTVHTNIFLWNKKLSRYVKARHYEKTVKLFQQMQQEDLPFDKFTFIPVLNACASLHALEDGRRTHAQIIRSGCESDVYVGNCLVHMYAKCGSIEDAWRVFSGLPMRDTVGWSAIIRGHVKFGQGKKALDLFRRMQQEGVEPVAATFVGALNACASIGALDEGRRVHKQIVQSGFNSGVFVGTSLIDMYAKCGSLEDAWKVFNEMPTRNVVSWNVMIQGHAKAGQGKKALELYEQMQREGFEPDSLTFVGVLNACAGMAALDEGRRVHSQIIQRGFESSVFVGTSLVDMYAKCGSIDDAWKAFSKLPTRNVVSWNAMIQGQVKCGQGQKALELFQKMQQEGVEPGPVTFVGVLNACASVASLEEGRRVHELIIQRGYESHVFVGNSLIDMYTKCGSTEDACRVFSRMPTRTVVAWSALILGYAKCGQGHKALELFQQMQVEGVKPVAVTFIGALIACASVGALDEGRRVHEQLIQSGCESDAFVASSLVDMYAKCGSIEDAWRAFKGIPVHDVVSWSAMILAYARCEEGKKALELFRQMGVEGLEPLPGTFVGVLNACATVVALDEGRRIHEQIMKRGFEADVFVGSSLIDMYAKCGSIDDAQRVFNKMPVLNLVTWNTMLGGYALHGLGEKAIAHFQRMCQQGVEVDMVTFVSLLSACSHAGLVEEGLHYLESMSSVYNIPATLEHYSCVVNLLAHAGHLHEAEDLINAISCQPDATVWMSLLSACRAQSNVEMGERIANRLLELNPGNVAGHVLLTSIYAAADGTAANISGNEPGRAWIEVNSQVHSFIVNDREHPQIIEIHAQLDSISRQMKDTGYVSDRRLVSHGIEEEEKVIHHSEKLALGFGLINSPPGTAVRIFKNHRVCGNCHDAMKLIGKLVGRLILVRDTERFHQFEDGQCTCGD